MMAPPAPRRPRRTQVIAFTTVCLSSVVSIARRLSTGLNRILPEIIGECPSKTYVGAQALDGSTAGVPDDAVACAGGAADADAGAAVNVLTCTSTMAVVVTSAAPVNVPLIGMACSGSRPTATRINRSVPMMPLVGSNSTQPAPGR